MIVPAAPVGGIDHRQRFGCTRNRIHLLVTPSWAPLQKDICGGALHRNVRFHIQSCDYVVRKAAALGNGRLLLSRQSSNEH